VDEIAAALLVGGRARRFDGTRKPALVVGEQTIVERQLDAIRGAGIRSVWMIGRWGAELPDGVTHVPDLVDNAGPLGGLYSALLIAVAPVVVVLAGDMPFVQTSFVRTIASVPADVDAIVPRDAAGWHPLAAAYRRGVASRIKARIDRGSLRVIEALGDLRVHAVTSDTLQQLDAAGMLLMNVNTPDDYRAAAHHARRDA
jgi:molybdopterin-guanine dinucleotide biosynthesis protein A